MIRLLVFSGLFSFSCFVFLLAYGHRLGVRKSTKRIYYRLRSDTLYPPLQYLLSFGFLPPKLEHNELKIDAAFIFAGADYVNVL